MHFDSHFGPAKIGPREQSQRQIDGHGVEGVKSDFDVGSEFLPGIKRLGFLHKTLGKIRPELPVKLLVRVCQSGLGNRLQEAQMVASFGSRIQTTGDVPQSVAPRQLSKGHAVELLTAAKIPPPRIHVVVVHQTVERLAVDQIEKLRHNRSARIHALNRDLNSNGSSGKSVGFVAWSSGHEVKLSEMEEDGSAVVLEGAEASGVGFDGLDPAVEGLC